MKFGKKMLSAAAAGALLVTALTGCAGGLLAFKFHPKICKQIFKDAYTLWPSPLIIVCIRFNFLGYFSKF